MALLAIRHDHYFHIAGSDALAFKAITYQLAHITEKLNTMSNAILGNLDDILAKMKSQTTVINSIDKLVQELANKLDAAIKGAKDLEAAADKVADIMDVVQENADALIAAANINTPDATPADAEVVKAFEALPAQPLDKPE